MLLEGGRGGYLQHAFYYKQILKKLYRTGQRFSSSGITILDSEDNSLDKSSYRKYSSHARKASLSPVISGGHCKSRVTFENVRSSSVIVCI